ncbi:hypothetical protein BGX29_001777, partial [Mortierella sp. GBA35]
MVPDGDCVGLASLTVRNNLHISPQLRCEVLVERTAHEDEGPEGGPVASNERKKVVTDEVKELHGDI